ncbi:MAG: hypothetical protein ACE5E1_06465 [Phycisphaerae bacterium]
MSYRKPRELTLTRSGVFGWVWRMTAQSFFAASAPRGGRRDAHVLRRATAATGVGCYMGTA